jgi:hypothetical protein
MMHLFDELSAWLSIPPDSGQNLVGLGKKGPVGTKEFETPKYPIVLT